MILVEGAGSPAEINLRDRDIANMGFAEGGRLPGTAGGGHRPRGRVCPSGGHAGTLERDGEGSDGSIHDPFGLEGEPGNSAGLGLLAISTTLERHKQLRNVTGKLALDEAPVSGYEIHAGVTSGEALERPAVHLEDRSEGDLSADGRILGTYLHGLFESALLRWAGLRKPQTPDYHHIRDANIDRLADACETHLDLSAIERILGIDTAGGREHAV